MIKFEIKNIKDRFGFTLIEILVAISLFLIIILLVSSFFSLSNRSYNKGVNSAELVQNARVGLDRITREIRQSIDIISILPPDDSNPLNPPISEIMFQDGHNISEIVYIRYYLDGTDLKRDRIEYYFDSEPSLKVLYNSVDEFGDPPIEFVIENRVVGEYFKKINFWGQNNQIYVFVELENGKYNFKARSSVYGRN